MQGGSGCHNTKGTDFLHLRLKRSPAATYGAPESSVLPMFNNNPHEVYFYSGTIYSRGLKFLQINYETFDRV